MGTESCLSGLPSPDDKADPKVGVTITLCKAVTPNIYAPTGFDGNFDDQSALQNAGTYLIYDYTKDENYYDTTNKIKYGPSMPTTTSSITSMPTSRCGRSTARSTRPCTCS